MSCSHPKAEEVSESTVYNDMIVIGSYFCPDCKMILPEVVFSNIKDSY